MGLLANLVAADDTDGRTFLHGAFTVALDDFAEHRYAGTTVADAAVVAGALAVMARLDARRIDPVRLVDDEREETAMMLVERCAAYAPFFAEKAPSLSPWFDALAGSGAQIDAALDGGDADTFDTEWLGKLAPTVFRFPAPRRYLTRFIDRVLAMLDTADEPSAALWICLRLRKWVALTDRQRAILERHVASQHDTRRHELMRAALRRLDPAT